MKQNRLLFFLLLLFPAMLFAQQTEVDTTSVSDEKYREDQFYVGFTYNLITDRPQGIRNQGFSGGMHLGFLRDMPINKRRNLAIALGLGYAVNKYGHNLFVGENETEQSVFVALNEDYDYETNRFATHEIEVPLELRWRTSTAENYRFWRIYGGVKLGYVYYYKATYIEPGNKIEQTDIPEYNQFRTTAMLHFGYNTFNFQLQYSFTPFFKSDALVNNQQVGLNTIKIGLIFYIL